MSVNWPKACVVLWLALGVCMAVNLGIYLSRDDWAAVLICIVSIMQAGQLAWLYAKATCKGPLCPRQPVRQT